MLHPLIDAIDIDLSGPEAAYDWLLPSLPRWSPRAHLQPRTEITMHVDFRTPPTAGDPVLQLPLVEVSRAPGGELLVTAPRVGARIGGRDVELYYEPSASPRCVQAVFDAIWPLVLPAFGLHHLRAGAVRDEEARGWLLVGHPGAGKSTSTLALASMGWHFAADESVYVSGRGDGIVAHGWAAPIRVTARTAHAFGLERRAPHTEIKADAILDVSLAARRVDCVAVDRLLFVELGPVTSLQPMCAHETLDHLVAASPWLRCLPGRTRHYLEQLESLATVPASTLVLGPDLLEEPERLAQYLGDSLAQVAA